MIHALFLVPLAAGLLAFVLRSDSARRTLLVVTALAHAVLTAACWAWRPPPGDSDWLALDALGLVFLGIVSALFLAATPYAVGYLGREPRDRHPDFEEPRRLFTNEPEAVFTGCLLLFLASMTLVTLSHHFGLLWVGIEATTLVSAPLIYFHRHHRSLEATWKYLLLCSVGIALALLGTYLLEVAVYAGEGEAVPLVLGQLLALEPGQFHVNWLEVAFLFFLVGYGTKMGLAPLHTWLPDAHSESPSVVSALLSGALLNCAFLGILRAHQVCVRAGVGWFSADLLLVFGLLSMAVAGIFILRQTDYKRLLAYSSVENMGILAVGVGLGGAGAFGATLHAVNHSLAKAGLFLVAGNILAAYETKAVQQTRGVLHLLPLSGVLWLAGFLALSGMPPFGVFLSKFTILKAALDTRHPAIAGLFLAVLALIFAGMVAIFLAMAQGKPSAATHAPARREPLWMTVPPAALLLLVLALGLYVPPGLNAVLHEAARALGGY